MPAPEADHPLGGGVARQLLLCPDPALRRVCEPAGYLAMDAQRALAADLLATLLAAGGRAISAPQIGVPRRLVLLLAAGEDGPLVLCDPELLELRGAALARAERCLCWPGGEAAPARCEDIRLGWYDMAGIYHRRDLAGTQARLVQQQIDILGGRFIGGF